MESGWRGNHGKSATATTTARTFPTMKTEHPTPVRQKMYSRSTYRHCPLRCTSAAPTRTRPIPTSFLRSIGGFAIRNAPIPPYRFISYFPLSGATSFSHTRA